MSEVVAPEAIPARSLRPSELDSLVPEDLFAVEELLAWTPGERPAWEVRLTGRAQDHFGDRPFSRWDFRLVPVDSGAQLHDTAEDLRSDELRASPLAFLPEVPDRAQRNRETTATTLERIAEACEGAVQ